MVNSIQSTELHTHWGEKYHITDFADVNTILDIGGNVGEFAIYAMARFDPNKIIIVEPDPFNFPELMKNLGDYISDGVVDFLPVAVGANYGFSPFSANRGIESHICYMTHKSSESLCKCNIYVPTVPLSEIVQFYDIDLLKCNVEGGEFYIFLVVPETTMKRIKFLTIEFHDCRSEEMKYNLWNKLNETHRMTAHDYHPLSVDNHGLHVGDYGQPQIWTGTLRA